MGIFGLLGLMATITGGIVSYACITEDIPEKCKKSTVEKRLDDDKSTVLPIAAELWKIRLSWHIPPLDLRLAARLAVADALFAQNIDKHPDMFLIQLRYKIRYRNENSYAEVGTCSYMLSLDDKLNVYLRASREMLKQIDPTKDAILYVYRPDEDRTSCIGIPKHSVQDVELSAEDEAVQRHEDIHWI